jgi:predicted GTPase
VYFVEQIDPANCTDPHGEVTAFESRGCCQGALLRAIFLANTRPRQQRNVVLFTNGTLPPGYKRYLERELRAEHDFVGVPLLLDDRPPAQRAQRRERRARGHGRR